jgi:hypothetical protein
MKIELLNGEQRAFKSRSYDVIRRKDAKAFARNRQTFDEGDLQVVKFDMAVEAGAKGLDDPALKDGLCPSQHHFADHEENNDGCQRNPQSQSPTFVFS